MPPPIWKKPSPASAVISRVPLGERGHVLDAAADRRRLRHAAVDDPRREDIAEGRVLPARYEERQVAFGGGHHPRVRGVDLVVLLEEAFVERLVEELVGKVPLARAVGPLPQIEQHVLHPAHRLFLGDAGVGDPVEVAVEQRLFVGPREVAVVGDADVVVVRHQIEDVLLEVGAGAADAVDLALADHLGQRQPDLGGGHGARHGAETSGRRRRCGRRSPWRRRPDAAALKWR